MNKKIAALCLAVCLVLTLCACGNKTISAEKAQQIVLDDLGVSADEVEMHLHVGEFEGEPCFSIYVTIDEATLEYLIDSQDGTILDIRASSHSH